jgi:hypothetical protein
LIRPVWEHNGRVQPSWMDRLRGWELRGELREGVDGWTAVAFADALGECVDGFGVVGIIGLILQE